MAAKPVRLIVFDCDGTLDVSAPLPPHMQQSWNLLGFDSSLGEAEPEG